MPGGYTSYNPRDVDTAVSFGRGGGGGGGGIDDLIHQILRQKLQGMTPQKASPIAPAWGSGGGPRSFDAGAGRIERPTKTPLQVAAEQAQMAKFRAISEPAPMRKSYVGGLFEADTPDANAMNGAQREVFTPAGSGFGPSNDSERAAAADADWQRTGRETAARRRVQFGGA